MRWSAVVAAGAAGAALVSGVAPAEPATGKSPRPKDWLLREFDWGDGRAIVEESVVYHPDFTCHVIAGSCGGVTVDLEGETFVARFGYSKRRRGLSSVRIMTPDAEPAYAEELERLWRHLIDFYGARYPAPTHSETDFPALDALGPKEVHVTHSWELAEQHIRIGVGRRKTDLYYVFAAFKDPAAVDREKTGAARTSVRQAPEPTPKP